jgi:hypothetical protein
VEGLICTLIEPGSLPETGVTINHWSGGVVTVKAGVPAVIFIVTDCAGGSTAPTCQVNVSAVGVAVTVCAFSRRVPGSTANKRTANDLTKSYRQNQADLEALSGVTL